MTKAERKLAKDIKNSCILLENSAERASGESNFKFITPGESAAGVNYLVKSALKKLLHFKWFKEGCSWRIEFT